MISGKARVAAVIFLALGTALLLSVWVWGRGSSGGPARIGGPVIRGLGLILIGWGLLRGAGWAWLLGVVFPALWVLLGVFTIVRTDGSSAPVPSLIAVIVFLVLLASGWGLLMAPDVRRRYRNSRTDD